MSRTTEETIDRLLGRKRAPMWPWIAAGIGLVAVVGAVAAWFAWFRRPSWRSEPWTATVYETETIATPAETGFDATGSSKDEPTMTTRSSRSSAAKSTPDSAGSAPDPIEEA